MTDLQMGAIESRFADIIWQNEPISSSELARCSEEELKWKKTTSFTVLKRLCNKGIFQNNKGNKFFNLFPHFFDCIFCIYVTAG